MEKKTARSSELDLNLLREGQREGRERCGDEEKLGEERELSVSNPFTSQTGKARPRRGREVLTPATSPHLAASLPQVFPARQALGTDRCH